MAQLKVVTVEEMKSVIRTFNKMSNPPTLMFFGDPGVGKTFGIVDVAKELEAEYIPLSLGRLEAYDIKGIPDVSGEFTKWKVPYFWHVAIKAANAGKRVFIHCDEATLAEEAVQGAILDVIWQKTIDDIKLPDSIQFIFTGNMGGEDGTFARAFSSALTGGRGFIYGVKPPEIEEWLNYQKPVKFIENFIKAYGHKVFYVPARKDSPFEPWTNPRAWSQLDAVIKETGLDPVENVAEIMMFAKGIHSPTVVSLLQDFIGDAIINPQGLVDMKAPAWAQYKKQQKNPAKRKVALNDALDIMLPIGTVLATKESRQAVVDTMNKFFAKLVEFEDVMELITGFGREFGRRQPMVYDSVEIKGMKLSKYFNELLKEEVAKAPKK